MSRPEWWSTPPTRSGEARIRNHGNEVAVFNPETEVLTLMNPSAFALWELCDGETTPDEMVAAVTDLAKVDKDAAIKDVANGLAALAELGLVELMVADENTAHDG